MIISNEDYKLLCEVEEILHERQHKEYCDNVPYYPEEYPENQLFDRFYNFVERVSQARDKNREHSRSYNKKNKEYHNTYNKYWFAKKRNNQELMRKYEKELEEMRGNK